MSMHRFFISPEWIDGQSVAIRGRLVHRLRRVLRLGRGDRITVLDNSGWEYEVQLEEVGKESVRGVVTGKALCTSEPATRVTLYQALLKGDRFAFVLEKGTEVGVAAFVPMLCQRGVADAPQGGKAGRWERIITEAAEQSRRGRLPALHPLVSFAEACRTSQGLSLLPWEEESESSLRSALRANKADSINIFIGPEGGFTPEEVELACAHGVVPVTLGRRILRAETAGLVAAAAVLYERGDLGR